MFIKVEDTSHSRRKFLLTASSLATMAGVGIPGAALAQESDVLRAGITGFNVVNTLDPAKASLLSEFYVIWGCFNSLLKYDADMNIVPDLAESYETIDGGIEFILRKGVKFHNGDEFTAEDVKFTLERLIDEATQSPNRARFSDIKEIRIVDEHRVQILADSSLATLMSSLTNTRTGSQIVSRKAFEEMGAESF